MSYCNDCAGMSKQVSDLKAQLILEKNRRDIGKHELKNLLAIIHRDGGHHTAKVGIVQSVEDAHLVWAELMSEVGMSKEILLAVSLKDKKSYDAAIKAFKKMKGSRI